MSFLTGLFGGSEDPNAQMAAEQRKKEAERTLKIQQGTQAIDDNFAQFDDNYFQNRAKAYDDYAEPQLEKQFNDARKALTFALSRSGNLNSTIAGEKQRDLNDVFARNRQSIEDAGQGYATNARKGVADSRSNLINLLNSTEDPAAARSEAVSQAGILGQPDTFSPLGQLFLSFTQGLNNSVNNPAQGYSGSLGTSLFQNGSRNGGGLVVS